MQTWKKIGKQRKERLDRLNIELGKSEDGKLPGY